MKTYEDYFNQHLVNAMYFMKHLCTVNKPIQEYPYGFCGQRTLLVVGW